MAEGGSHTPLILGVAGLGLVALLVLRKGSAAAGAPPTLGDQLGALGNEIFGAGNEALGAVSNVAGGALAFGEHAASSLGTLAAKGALFVPVTAPLAVTKAAINVTRPLLSTGTRVVSTAVSGAGSALKTGASAVGGAVSSVGHAIGSFF